MLLSRPISYVPTLFPNPYRVEQPTSKPIYGGVGCSIITAENFSKGGFVMKFEDIRNHQDEYSRIAQQEAVERKTEFVRK